MESNNSFLCFFIFRGSIVLLGSDFQEPFDVGSQTLRGRVLQEGQEHLLRLRKGDVVRIVWVSQVMEKWAMKQKGPWLFGVWIILPSDVMT